MVRYLDYYDLIELPSGKHIPVPLAIKTVGIHNVLRIPVSDKKRDDYFYYCSQCDLYDDWNEGYSFFRCTRHKPISQHETVSKLTMLKLLCELGMHDHMRYIEVDRDCGYARSKGFILVLRDGRYMAAYNLMFHMFDWIFKLMVVTDDGNTHVW